MNKKLSYTFKSLSLSLLIAVGASSCSSFLEVDTVDSVSPDSYYKSNDQMQKAVVAAYAPIKNFGLYRCSYVTVMDLGSDDALDAENIFPGYSSYNIPADDWSLFHRTNGVANGEISGGYGIYNSLYEGIMRCNIVLANLEASQAENKPLIEGEVRFLRSLYYFHIANLWEEAVLITEENFNESKLPFESTENIYTLIEEDLNTIIDKELLPWMDSKSEGRASMEATKSLLARHYLYINEPTKAEPLLAEVIDRGTYGLIPVEDIWTLQADDSKEHIFEVQIMDDGGVNPSFDDNKNSALFSLRNLYFGAKQHAGFQNIVPTEDLVKAFEAGDLRKENFVMEAGDKMPYATLTEEEIYSGNPLKYCILKGTKSGFYASSTSPSGKPVDGSQSENVPLIRYADVLLMHAETVIDSDPTTAKQEIDQVRARAFGYESVEALRAAGKGVEDYMNAEGVSLFEALKHERRVELCFEGLRYFDLVRWGDAANNDILKTKGWTVDKKKYYPVPIDDINFNNTK